MRFEPITGPPQIVQCLGCLEERVTGSQGERSASGRLLDAVYRETASGGLYCETCAAKHAEGIDTTKALTQFYADTRGERILTYETV